MKTNSSKKEDIELEFRNYYHPLVKFVFKYLKHYEDSKDVVQKAFVKLWMNVDRLDIHSSTKSYLYSTVKNAMIDHMRKTHRLDFLPELENTLIIEDVYEEVMDSYLVRQIIQKSISKLKPRTQEIFILNKFEGLTYSEIAMHLGISKRTVEENIYKSIEYIKNDLKNHPELFCLPK